MDFEYVHYIDTDEPELLVYSHIGMDSELGPGVNGLKFAEELKALDQMGKKRICIRVNSPGGVVDDGQSIFSAILAVRNTPVDCYNDGLAASTAGWIFCAGRNRIAASYSNLMIHMPYIDGEASEKDKEALEYITNSIAEALSARSGKSKEEILYLMGEETWYDAKQQVAEGFATEIAEASESNTGDSVYEMAGGDLMNAWRMAKILNGKRQDKRYIKTEGMSESPEINTKNTTLMSKKVAKSLGLAEDATEEQILAAVINLKAAPVAKNDKDDDDDDDDDDDLSSRMDDCEAKMDDIGKGIDDLKVAHGDLMDKHAKMDDKFGVVFDKLSKRMDDLEAAKDVTYDDKKNEAAVALINKYSTRIGNVDVKTMTNWIEKAQKDPVATEAELLTIPLNVKSLAKETERSLIVNTVSTPPTSGDPVALAEWYARDLRAKLDKK